MRPPVYSQPLQLHDYSGTLAQNIADHWLIGMREANPGILDMFHERELQPYRDFLPWSGEFAGKYITGACYIYRLTRSERLLHYMQGFLAELLTCIDEDGYVGCFQKQCRLTGAYSQTASTTGSTWDAWSHYHIMFGLYLWHEETHDPALWQALLKIADFFLTHFYNGRYRLASIGFPLMNLSPYHIFAVLAAETGESRYLDFAQQIEKDVAVSGGNYLNNALTGLPFYRGNMPRWEAMHTIMGFSSMYDATGNENYRTAAVQIYRSIAATDIHNTGGFSTDEQAVGTPFRNGSIELCATTAFNAFAAQVYQLTQDSAIADFLELSLYNAVLGSFSPGGRWSTYDTPMDGLRMSNTQICNFQSRAGTPQLNCCSASSARAVGTLSEWALLQGGGTVYLNYYGALSCCTADGLSIEIQGTYPACGDISITCRAQTPQRIALRIPAWSPHTRLTVGGKQLQPEGGAYAYVSLDAGTTQLHLQLELTPRMLRGEDAQTGKCCVYAGPVLFGIEPLLNPSLRFHDMPAINETDLFGAQLSLQKNGRLLLELSGGMVLGDFCRLGQTGAQYKTWLPLKKDSA